MKYTQTVPCKECPFLKQFSHGYTIKRLWQFASAEFACHKTAEIDDESGNYLATKESVHCAGALIFLEKRDKPHQMMRICERLGLYDRRKLKMDAPVR